jgi:hypothetical protein
MTSGSHGNTNNTLIAEAIDSWNKKQIKKKTLFQSTNDTQAIDFYFWNAKYNSRNIVYSVLPMCFRFLLMPIFSFSVDKKIWVQTSGEMQASD